MNKTSPRIQLFLPVQIRLENRFEYFLGDANTKVLEALRAFVEQRTETLLFLVGPESAGKTHLLSAAVHYFDEVSASVSESNVPCAGYFSLAELIGEKLDQAALSELASFLEGFEFLALDDMDAWLQGIQAESGLSLEMAETFMFGLFNHFKEHNKQLLIASKTVPSRLNIQLKDLESRLASGLLVTITKLNDQEKDQLIRALAKLRGFLLDDDVSAFILKRSGRDLSDLLNILDKLDQASLIEKRKLTVPFVKKILNW